MTTEQHANLIKRAYYRGLRAGFWIMAAVMIVLILTGIL